MKHELECRQMRIRGWQLCDCSVIRAAYWRGRDDAANAVVRVPRWQYPDHADNRWVIDAEDACSAARGDGEQA